MYTETDYQTKKALKEAVARGDEVFVYQPGVGTNTKEGWVTLEGPHFPKPHTWYAEALLHAGLVIKVK